MKIKSIVIVVLLFLFLSGCTVIKYYSTKPSEALLEADFYGKFANGLVFIVQKSKSDRILIFWIENQGEKLVRLDRGRDEIACYIDNNKHILLPLCGSEDYIKQIKPGGHAIIMATGETGYDGYQLFWSAPNLDLITKVSFRIGSEGKEFIIPKREE